MGAPPRSPLDRATVAPLHFCLRSRCRSKEHGFRSECIRLLQVVTSLATGTVKWFSPKKGFGFILPDDGSAEVFVHYLSIASDEQWRILKPQDVVEFDLQHGPKGPHARNVRQCS